MIKDKKRSRHRSKDQQGSLVEKALKKARKKFTCLEDPRTHGKLNPDSGNWFNACFYRVSFWWRSRLWQTTKINKNIKTRLLNDVMFPWINRCVFKISSISTLVSKRKIRKRAATKKINIARFRKKSCVFSPIDLIPNDGSELFLARYINKASNLSFDSSAISIGHWTVTRDHTGACWLWLKWRDR